MEENYNAVLFNHFVQAAKIDIETKVMMQGPDFAHIITHGENVIEGKGRSKKIAKAAALKEFFQYIKTTKYSSDLDKITTESLKNLVSSIGVNNQNVQSATLNVPSDRIPNKNGRFIWVDAEMTGLDVNVDRIIEIACIITEDNLDVVDTLLPIVIHHSEDVFSRMDEWCKNTHRASGLIDESLASKISAEDADIMLTDFVEKHTAAGKCCLAGNSVYMDANFIGKEFPNFKKHLHYRIIDVSSVKELCKKWNYEKYKAMPPKKLAHRALDDIKDSIEELRFYKQTFFDNNAR